MPAIPDVVLLRKTFGAPERRFVSLEAIVERIRREAGETFDVKLDHEFRDLANLIEREFGDAR